MVEITLENATSKHAVDKFQYFSNPAFMTKIIIGQRGVLTLPAKLRKRYGLQESDELMVEETPQGLLLRPCVSMPIEYYSEERIAEFNEDDAAIGRALDQISGRS